MKGLVALRRSTAGRRVFARTSAASSTSSLRGGGAASGTAWMAQSSHMWTTASSSRSASSLASSSRQFVHSSIPPALRASNSTSSSLVDCQLNLAYPQQQQQRQQPLLHNHYDHMNQHQQRRHMVMITKTKAGGGDDISNKDNVAVVVEDTANATLDTPTSNTTPSPQQQEQLIITEACWNKIEQLAAAKKQSDIYLRVVIDAGGCSGFSYKFEFDTNANLDATQDVVFTRRPAQNSRSNNNDPCVARVVVDTGSLEYIQGSTIDYVQEMIKSSFQVRDNPQSESACGCGSSFAVKNVTANPALD